MIVAILALTGYIVQAFTREMTTQIVHTTTEILRIKQNSSLENNLGIVENTNATEMSEDVDKNTTDLSWKQTTETFSKSKWLASPIRFFVTNTDSTTTVSRVETSISTFSINSETTIQTPDRDQTEEVDITVTERHIFPRPMILVPQMLISEGEKYISEKTTKSSELQNIELNFGTWQYTNPSVSTTPSGGISETPGQSGPTNSIDADPSIEELVDSLGTTYDNDSSQTDTFNNKIPLLKMQILSVPILIPAENSSLKLQDYRASMENVSLLTTLYNIYMKNDCLVEVLCETRDINETRLCCFNSRSGKPQAIWQFCENEIVPKYVTTADIGTDNPNLSCYATFSSENKDLNNSTSTSYIPSYWMVTRCPENYTIQDDKQLCESESSDDLIDNIPVIVNNEKVVIYKNRHCLSCHGMAEQQVIPFSVIVTVTSDDNFVDKFLSGLLTKKHLRSLKVNTVLNDYRNILKTSLPDQTLEIKDHPLPCGLADKITEVSNETCNDTKILYACETFYLPTAVDDHLSGISRIFKNIACGICVSSRNISVSVSFLSDNFDGSCYGKLRTHSIQMNMAPVFFNTLEEEDIMMYIHVLPRQLAHKSCQIGYVKDFQTDLCRKVSCQRRYVLSDGFCAPLLLQSAMTFYVKLKAIYYETTHDELIRKLSAYFQDEKLLDVCELRLSSYSNHSNIKQSVVELWLKNSKEDETYESVLQKIRPFAYSLNNIPTSTMIDSKIHLSPGDEAYVDDHSAEFRIINLTNFLRLNPLNYDLQDLYKCKREMPIGKLDYCMRIVLNPEEFKIFNNVPVFLIKNQSKVIFPDNYELMTNGSVLICIDDYINLTVVDQINAPIETSNSLMENNQSDANLTTTYFSSEPRFSLIQKVIYYGVLGVLAIVTVVVVYTRIRTCFCMNQSKCFPAHFSNNA